MTITSPQEGVAALPADQIDYVDLYQRWEKGNWSAYAVDFSQDKIDWQEKFTETMRRGARWNYSLFFYGEDSVADNLSPFIDAAPLEEQKYFLATHQVDEARHSILFARFFQEVMGVEPGGSLGQTLAATDPDLTWGFRKVFNHLDKVVDELRRDRSKPMLAKAVTMYMMIVEASLAQTGQHFIADYLDNMDLLPGFAAGMENVSKDEQRHIAFGVKLLADLNREDPEVKDAVAELLRDVTPWLAGVFVPPNWDMSLIECFGGSMEGLFADGFRSLDAKMKAAGLPLTDLPGAVPFAPGLSFEERSRRSIVLLKAGVLGAPTDTFDPSPEVLELMFDAVTYSINPNHGLKKPMTIQWKFSDAEPWYLNINNGSTVAKQGIAASADVTLKSRFGDWANITAGRADPRKSIMQRKIRPSGSPLAILKLPKIFM